MMSLPHVANRIQTVLTDIAREAVEESGFCQRESGLGNELFVQTIVLTCLEQPQPTLDDYAQTAAAGGCSVSSQAFDQRFTSEAVSCLKTVLERVVQERIFGREMPSELVQRFPAVEIQDASVIVLRDEANKYFQGKPVTSENAALKLQLGLILNHGGLRGPKLEDETVADVHTALDNSDLPEGSLHIADRGYFQLDRFADLSQRGVYWMTDYQRPTAIYLDDNKMDLHRYLAKHKGICDRIDVSVELGKTHRLPCRLLAWRVKPEVAACRRQRVKEQARDNGCTASKEQLALCDWSICLTTVPEDKADLQEAAVLLRARWQIEILFRVWKSGGHVDKSRSQKADRMTAEVLGKLIAQVMSHWIMIVSGWEALDLSWWKASKAIRQVATSFIVLLYSLSRLLEQLEQIHRRIEQGARTQSRQQRPATFQRLEDPWCIDIDEL